MRLQTLLHKQVIAADGVPVGRVYNFQARREGQGVVITHLRVGAVAWLGRLHLQGLLYRLLGAAKEMDIPWEAIATVDQDVRLKPEWDRARCEQCIVREDTEDTDQ
jgi:sporulation protein YlmC with PRC-barrel domain